MADYRAHQIILLAGVHPLIVANSCLHAQDTCASVQYKIVTVDADECTLLPVVDRLKPEFIVLDLLRADGLRTIRRIANVHPSCHVLVVTGVGNREGMATAFSSGAAGILYRADGLSELFDAVRTLRSGQQFMSSTLRQAFPTANMKDTGDA
jgi:DNA-binding NarL/FixJ family response regulator